MHETPQVPKRLEMNKVVTVMLLRAAALGGSLYDRRKA